MFIHFRNTYTTYNMIEIKKFQKTIILGHRLSTSKDTFFKILQLVEHLTRDSGGLGTNPVLVRQYVSHLVTFGAVTNLGINRLTPVGGRAWGDFKGEDHLREEECDDQTGSNAGARYSSKNNSSIGKVPEK